MKTYGEEDRSWNDYVFPALVCMKELIASGEVSHEKAQEILEKNLEAYHHAGEYTLPEDWFDLLDTLCNKSGWRIFEYPKVREEQAAEAQKRREEKAAKLEVEKLARAKERAEKEAEKKRIKAEKAAKAAAKKIPPEPPAPPPPPPVQPVKKRVIVVRKKA
jgi:hypothetical protein